MILYDGVKLITDDGITKRNYCLGFQENAL